MAIIASVVTVNQTSVANVLIQVNASVSSVKKGSRVLVKLSVNVRAVHAVILKRKTIVVVEIANAAIVNPASRVLVTINVLVASVKQ